MYFGDRYIAIRSRRRADVQVLPGPWLLARAAAPGAAIFEVPCHLDLRGLGPRALMFLVDRLVARERRARIAADERYETD